MNSNEMWKNLCLLSGWTAGAHTPKKKKLRADRSEQKVYRLLCHRFLLHRWRRQRLNISHNVDDDRAVSL
jgi:hypothetical protein